MGRDGPLDSCGKKVLKRQIFFVSYLQFVERKPLHTVLCSTAYGAAEVARELQAAVRRLYPSNPKEAPKKMVVVYNLGGECIELAVINIKPKDNKTCK